MVDYNWNNSNPFSPLWVQFDVIFAQGMYILIQLPPQYMDLDNFYVQEGKRAFFLREIFEPGKPDQKRIQNSIVIIDRIVLNWLEVV